MAGINHYRFDLHKKTAFPFFSQEIDGPQQDGFVRATDRNQLSPYHECVVFHLLYLVHVDDKRTVNLNKPRVLDSLINRLHAPVDNVVRRGCYHFDIIPHILEIKNVFIG